MEDHCSVSPSSVTSSYEETDLISANTHEQLFKAALVCNSMRSKTSVVRHNFKSIEQLLSPTPVFHDKNNDTGYDSLLSICSHNQCDDEDELKNLQPKISSTPYIRKETKVKKPRTAFTDDQKQCLDRFYSFNRYPDPSQMETLSQLLSLEERVIRVWFQNKRSRERTYPKFIYDLE
ncbi:unnamed protein product [Adineta ricciae]|uniref:Homeobox domain-containing protein n=1 Tax=Adineta ricciae TaxID=249248 RepID=A0A815J8K7_ADIRI|nr:unnamed protein product [Adineta ricciae]CAF1376080.1 unnamed protein product [Adineta ricciae]